MDKDLTYSITIKLSGFPRYISETDYAYTERVKAEGKKRISYYLSGYLFDPDHKIISEEVSLDNKIK